MPLTTRGTHRPHVALNMDEFIAPYFFQRALQDDLDKEGLKPQLKGELETDCNNLILWYCIWVVRGTAVVSGFILFVDGSPHQGQTLEET